MRLVARFVWVLVLWVFPIVACNDLIDEPRTAPLTMTIQNNVPPRTALEGVRLCETDDDSNCDVSGADGEVAIWLPVNEEISYTIQKEGFDPTLVSFVVPEGGVSRFWWLTEVGVVADQYESVMSPYPRLGKGEILILLQPEFAGATFDLVGATGKAYYQVGRNVNATLRLDLTATTDDGVGGFLEVPPGTFRVKFGGTASRCVPTWAGWPGDVENSVRVRVLEGHVSYVTLRCPVPP